MRKLRGKLLAILDRLRQGAGVLKNALFPYLEKEEFCSIRKALETYTPILPEANPETSRMETLP